MGKESESGRMETFLRACTNKATNLDKVFSFPSKEGGTIQVNGFMAR